jgi:chorismate mutase
VADWLKVEKETPDKPEMLRLAAILSIHPDEALGKCFRFWRWCDSHSADGVLDGMNFDSIDALISCKKFAEALKKVGWLTEKNGVVRVPDYDKHMGQSAKRRALTAKRVAKSKAKKGNAAGNAVVTPGALPRTRGEQEENPIVKSKGETNGVQRHLPPIASRLTKDVGRKKKPVKADLPELDWEQAAIRAERIAKSIPPDSDDARRAWFKYAALSLTTFSEHWLVDAIEGTLRAKSIDTTPQAYFVGTLTRKALAENVSAETFASMRESLEVPDWLWQSDRVVIK